MKLQIDLSNREEVKAALPLLQLILEGSKVAAPLTVAPSIAVVPAPTIAPVAAPVSLAPPPAPSPLVPAAPTASAPPPPVGLTPPALVVELDKNGLPWDARIHASTKSKIADGSWKMKRGVEAATLQQVEAELRVSVGKSVDAAAVVAIVSPLMSGHALPGKPADMYIDTPNPATVFGAAPPAALAPPPAPAPSTEPATFAELMPRVSSAVVAKLMPPAALQDACAANGLAGVVALQQNPAYVPLVWASLKQAYPALV